MKEMKTCMVYKVITLALYEDNATSEISGIIVEGYYLLNFGTVLFLDFVYNPSNKTWWPINNYKYNFSKKDQRYMFQTYEICNPYKRNFI